MANFNKKISETSVRLGPVQFCYVNVFSPKKSEDDEAGKYQVQIRIPKHDNAAHKLITEAIEAAKKAGVASKWNGKMPSNAKLRLPLRDGDDEFPDDETYEGKYFMNCSSSKAPGVCVLENGVISEALDDSDFYSGCFGCITVNFAAYNFSGNMGVGCYMNNAIKTEDGERLSGGATAEQDFSDLTEGGSYLD